MEDDKNEQWTGKVVSGQEQWREAGMPARSGLAGQ
jgi:hypothetical protein